MFYNNSNMPCGAIAPSDQSALGTYLIIGQISCSISTCSSSTSPALLMSDQDDEIRRRCLCSVLGNFVQLLPNTKCQF